MAVGNGFGRCAVVRLTLVALVAASVGLCTAQESPATSSVATPVPPLRSDSAAAPHAPEDYLISAEDLLDVFIIDVPELSRQYRVTPTGTLEFPFLKTPLTAEGLTPAQLGDELAGALRSGGLVREPHISISVKESRLHSVAIAGAVKKPQVYTVFGRTTLLDVLSLAGGLDDAAGSLVRITRGPMGMRLTGSAPTGSDAYSTGQS